MQITPAQILTGDIVVQGTIPSLAVGRQVAAIVLSAPRDGLVMVSMFGKRFVVETTLDLHVNQTLNLRVHATTPRIVMKPVETASEAQILPRVLDRLVERFVGSFGNAPLASFDLREIVRRLVQEAGTDPALMQHILRLVEDASQLPQNTIAHLLVPFVEDEGRGSARVSIAREGEDYRLRFEVQTDALGPVESTVVRSAAGISVELSSVSEDITAFLRTHAQELAAGLEHLGVVSIDVSHDKRMSPRRLNVDVLV